VGADRSAHIVPFDGSTPPSPARGEVRGPGAISAVEWTWCLDLLRPLSALLGIAGALTTAQQRPGEEVETGGPLLNLYLVTCALDQILSDHLHAGFFDLAPLARGELERRLLRSASRMQRAVRRRLPRRALRRRQRDVQALALSLATRVLAGERSAGREAMSAVTRLRAGRWPAAVAASRLQVPQAFRGADLYPADARLLAARAAEAMGTGRAPVLVVGLRPSGLYLAPLCAAALVGLGHTVELLSMRPGVPLLPHEAARARRLAASDGWALVLDGLGGSGKALDEVTRALGELGLAPSRICLGARDLPERNGSPERKGGSEHDGGTRQAIVEPGEWRIDTLLADEAIEEWLNRPHMLERLGAETAIVVRGHRFGTRAEMPAVGLERRSSSRREIRGPGAPDRGPAPRTGASLPVVGERGPQKQGREMGCLGREDPSDYLTGVLVANRRPDSHALKLCEVELAHGSERWSELLLCRAVGLGFFGYHSWLVAACLGDLVPEVLGIGDGVLLVRWEEGEGPPEPVQPEDLEAIAAYAAARRRRLDLGAQRAAAGAGAGGRRVGRLLARGLGPVEPLAAAWMAESITRAVAPPRHVAVDGRMGPSEWVRSPQGGLRKLDFEEHGFDAGGRGVTDPIHDLASAVVGFRLEPDEERQLVAAYDRLSGDSRDLDARAAVQKLLVGTAELDAIRTEGLDLETRSGRVTFARELAIRETLLTRTVNGYLAAVHLDGVGSDGRGGTWVVDMDEVLEHEGLGFPCVSPATAQAVRSLMLHGHEVVLASGRSLGEVRERCRTFGLPGAVAEDGAVAWDQRRRQPLTLLSTEARQALERLRQALGEETSVLLDPRYRHSLSLFRHTDHGRVGVDLGEVVEVIERHRLHGLEVVEDARRTVVRAAGLNRAAAFERLRADRAAEGARGPLRVVTASPDDVELLRAAAGRYAVGGVDSPLRPHRAELQLLFVSRPQALLRIANRVLHGLRGTCRRCALPRPDAADRALVEALGLRDRARLGRLALSRRPGAMRGVEL
jgi:hypothetical protein